ncbi:MAG: hypothetical protein AB4352_12965 [Hormoscilla sp.]
MNHKKFYLLVDYNILCSYLVSKWIEAFGDLPDFQGVIVKEKVQPETVLQARNAFHAQYSGQKHFTDEINQALRELYPNIEPTDRAMIERDGIAPYSSTGYSQTIFIGDNLNGISAKEWLIEASKRFSTFDFCLRNSNAQTVVDRNDTIPTVQLSFCYSTLWSWNVFNRKYCHFRGCQEI